MGLKVCVCGGGGGAQSYHCPPIKKVSYASDILHWFIYSVLNYTELYKISNTPTRIVTPQRLTASVGADVGVGTQRAGGRGDDGLAARGAVHGTVGGTHAQLAPTVGEVVPGEMHRFFIQAGVH